MNDRHEKPESQESSTAPQAVEQVDAPIESVSGMEKVKEMAQSTASQDLKGGSTKQDDEQTQQAQVDELKDDRELMKERLLKNAPAEPEMRKEVEKVLEKKKESLESDIKKLRKKRNYHGLSLAIMQLRQVVHQLKSLAQASFEKLKVTWLDVVHKFA